MLSTLAVPAGGFPLPRYGGPAQCAARPGRRGWSRGPTPPKPSHERPPPMSTLTPVAAARGSDYAELSRRIRRAGLLDRRPRYYAVRLAALAAALGYTLVAMAVVGDSWYQLGL